MGPQEWRDALFLRYGLESPDLLTYCDRCQAKLSISHSLDCKKGGLVTARNNELRDGVADLAGKAFTPSHVKRTKATPAGSNGNSEHPAAPDVTDQKGDLLIRYLWKQGTDSVHDMRVVNTDALTYRMKEP